VAQRQVGDHRPVLVVPSGLPQMHDCLPGPQGRSRSWFLGAWRFDKATAP
jgi:hypothetical protein